MKDSYKLLAIAVGYLTLITIIALSFTIWK